jgi:hypothetical protein
MPNPTLGVLTDDTGTEPKKEYVDVVKQFDHFPEFQKPDEVVR